MSWSRETTSYGTLIRNAGGKDLGMAGGVLFVLFSLRDRKQA